MATLAEAMDAIEAEFTSLKSTDDVAGAEALAGELIGWVNEQVAEIYQKSIGNNVAGHAADVATRRANLNSVIT